MKLSVFNGGIRGLSKDQGHWQANMKGVFMRFETSGWFQQVEIGMFLVFSLFEWFQKPDQTNPKTGCMEKNIVLCQNKSMTQCFPNSNNTFTVTEVFLRSGWWLNTDKHHYPPELWNNQWQRRNRNKKLFIQTIFVIQW